MHSKKHCKDLAYKQIRMKTSIFTNKAEHLLILSSAKHEVICSMHGWKAGHT